MEEQKRKHLNMKLLGIIFAFTIISQGLFAQKLPINIINKKVEYCLVDTLSLVIENISNENLHVMIGLEKYSAYNVWEVVTENILMNKDEIMGKAKGGLQYYLTVGKPIISERKLNQINLPILIPIKNTENKLDIKFRLSASDDIDIESVMTGEFRLSIRCTRELYQSEFIVVKSKVFFIKLCSH